MVAQRPWLLVGKGLVHWGMAVCTRAFAACFAGALCLSAWAAPNPAAASPIEPDTVLRMGVSQSWAMPFARYANGQLKGGILLDLGQELATRLNLQLRVLVMPPKRVEAMLQAGEVDLHCLVSPKWLLQELPPGRWTEPLLRMDDVLLAPAKHPGAELDLSQVRGASVGLVISYLYPALDEALTSGRLRREDASTQAQVFEKMLRGRSDFGVSNRLIAEWFNKQHVAAERLKILQTLASLDTACALAPEPSQDPARIKAVLRQMLAEGVVEKILRRYR